MGVGAVLLQLVATASVATSSVATSSVAGVAIPNDDDDIIELGDSPLLSPEELLLLEALRAEAPAPRPRAIWWPAPRPGALFGSCDDRPCPDPATDPTRGPDALGAREDDERPLELDAIDEAPGAGPRGFEPSSIAPEEARAPGSSPRTIDRPSPVRPRADPLVDVGVQQRIPRARLLDSIGRTLAESFDRAPSPIGTVRGGRRVALSVDGVRIDPIVEDARRRWLAFDPKAVDHVDVSTAFASTSDPRTEVARADITMRAAPEDGAFLDVFGTGRSADRSAGVFVAGGAGGEDLGFAASAHVDRDGATRIATITGTDELGDPRRRFGGSFRGRWDAGAVRVTAGADIDDADVRTHLVYTRAALRLEGLAVDLHGAQLGYGADASTYQLGLDAALALAGPFALLAGGALASGAVDTASAAGALDRYEAYVGVRLDTAIFDATVSARWARYETRFGPRAVETNALLLGAVAEVALAAPLALRLSAQQGIRALAPTTLGTVEAPPGGQERSTTIDVGPILRFDSFWLRADVFVTWFDDTLLYRFPANATSVGDGRWYGIEAEGAWSITDALSFAGAVAWTRPEADAEDAYLDGVPSVRWFGALRYDLLAQGAYFSIHARGVSAPLIDSAARVVVDPLVRNAPLRSSRSFGASAGFFLGAGFSLRATVENVLDEVVVRHDVVAPGAGVDLRVMLGYAGW